jgi:hypothetical protein
MPAVFQRIRGGRQVVRSFLCAKSFDGKSSFFAFKPKLSTLEAEAPNLEAKPSTLEAKALTFEVNLLTLEQ